MLLNQHAFVFTLRLTCCVESSEALRVAVVVARECDDGKVSLRDNVLRVRLDATRVIVHTLANDESVSGLAASIRRPEGQLKVSQMKVNHLQKDKSHTIRGSVSC